MPNAIEEISIQSTKIIQSLRSIDDGSQIYREHIQTIQGLCDQVEMHAERGTMAMQKIFSLVCQTEELIRHRHPIADNDVGNDTERTPKE